MQPEVDDDGNILSGYKGIYTHIYLFGWKNA